jgi:hypothetical protein
MLGTDAEPTMRGEITGALQGTCRIAGIEAKWKELRGGNCEGKTVADLDWFVLSKRAEGGNCNFGADLMTGRGEAGDFVSMSSISCEWVLRAFHSWRVSACHSMRSSLCRSISLFDAANCASSPVTFCNRSLAL